MRYSKRSKWDFKRIITSPVACVVMAISLFVFIKATWNIHEKAVVSNERLSQAQNELTKLKIRQGDLSTKVSRLSSEAGLEAEIRSKYPAIKEGESVAVIVDDSQVAGIIQATTTIKVSWWSRLLHVFGI